MDPVQNLKSHEGMKNGRKDTCIKEWKHQDHEESARRSAPLETSYIECVNHSPQITTELTV